jgi:Tol biopolymer transport system component
MVNIDPEAIPTQFFVSCDSDDSLVANLSPDGNWFAASCGSWMQSQKMVVQNSKGRKYELNFDYLRVEIDRQDEVGWVYPEHWSTDGQFLYFSIGMYIEAYGVNQCYTHGIDSGVFRLNLDTGNVETIIGLEDTYRYFLASFAPNDRFIATDIDGVTLFDLSGDSTKLLNGYPGMSFAWSGDGSKLAYSVATCSAEKMEADTSSIFIYDTETGVTKKVLSVDGSVLYVRDWMDNEYIQFDRVTIVDFNDTSTSYLYDIVEDEYGIVTSTPTPTP